MAWQDRPYYRDSGGETGNPFMWLMNGSVPLFTIFGIRVRLHASLLVMMALVLLLGWGFGSTVIMRVQSVAMLFGVVLLHEFGHCFAARSVGGEANDILMTPLGGLAMTMAPRRPWPTFVTVAGGPAVNVIICLICGIALYVILGIFPLGPWTFGKIVPRDPGWFTISSYLFWIYAISWFLLVFNLLPVYPLDGGQLLQSVLWKPMGYYKSMLITVNIGIVGAVLMGMVGLATLSVFLIFIAAFCFLNSFHTRVHLKAEGPWGFTEEESGDYSAAYEPQTPKKSRFTQWRLKRARKRAMQEAQDERAEQAKIDAILAKVSANGMHSLNWLEKRTLKKATERQRQSESTRRRH